MSDFAVNTENGIWLCETKEPHSFDLPLASAISDFLRKEECGLVADLGCGAGDYTNHLRSCGFETFSCDGNPRTPEFLHKGNVVDLTSPDALLPTADWTICLEVGEHIPPQFEQVFIDNLCRSFKRGIILSWFPTEGHGIGHFNPKSNEYVKEQFMRRGLIYDELTEKDFRFAATHWWFLYSLMVFRRV